MEQYRCSCNREDKKTIRIRWGNVHLSDYDISHLFDDGWLNDNLIEFFGYYVNSIMNKMGRKMYVVTTQFWTKMMCEFDSGKYDYNQVRSWKFEQIVVNGKEKEKDQIGKRNGEYGWIEWLGHHY